MDRNTHVTSQILHAQRLTESSDINACFHSTGRPDRLLVGVLSKKLDVSNGKHKWLPVLYAQVQVVDQTTPPLSWNSFVGTGIQDRPVPPAKSCVFNQQKWRCPKTAKTS